jgi:uncharacterized protein YggE
VREQAAEARASACESSRAALEVSSNQAAATAASEIQSLQNALCTSEQKCMELQRLLQLKEAEYVENLRSSTAEVANLSTTILDLQQAYRYFC